MEEMGLSTPLEHSFTFLYKSNVGDGLWEHELDHVFIGQTDETPRPDVVEVAEWGWTPETRVQEQLWPSSPASSPLGSPSLTSNSVGSEPKASSRFPGRFQWLLGCLQPTVGERSVQAVGPDVDLPTRSCHTGKVDPTAYPIRIPATARVLEIPRHPYFPDRLSLEIGLFAGVVLAAGRSSRMGSPKALLTLEGQTFLSRVTDAMVGGGCDPVVVVTGPETEPDSRRIAELARSLGAMTAINPDQGSDQIESLRAALRCLPTDLAGVVVSPVDAPGASAGVVTRLMAAAPGAAVVMPTFGLRRGHPVLFGRQVLRELAEGDLPEGARTVIERHQQAVVEVAAGPEVLLDIDTPAEYRDLVGRSA
ncbi:MAG: NTP transferase domain-containing protein [Gemmatimonas sp.]|nr:NTP transferase domain-containing protein [Gemmatimonas sp.]